MYYIAIEGVIGVGKTSLARYLQQEFDASLLLEVFEENPFLVRFYEDRLRYAFQTQVFFLLSRYDQQRRIPMINRPLVSDYMFAKDHLFAQQNLTGDELTTYERVYEALAANVVQPDLVVYLRADTSVLMAQIARRDRPYERNMDEGYIEGLRVAYDKFFASYKTVPVLTIDTNEIDFVQHGADRAVVINQIRGTLGIGPLQTALPGLNQGIGSPIMPDIVPPYPELELENTTRRLRDFQYFHRKFDELKGFDTGVFLNFVKLQEEIGEFARALVQWSRKQSPERTEQLGNELADVLAYLLKLANYTDIDLESAYLEKMRRNRQRTWDTPQGND